MSARLDTRLSQIELRLEQQRQTVSNESDVDPSLMSDHDLQIFMEWYSAQRDEPGDVDFAPYFARYSPEGKALMRAHYPSLR